jgi:hypothetical protein
VALGQTSRHAHNRIETMRTPVDKPVMRHMWARTHGAQALTHAPQYLAGASVVFAFISIVAGLDSSVAPAWSGVAPAVEVANRIRKNDRLPRIPAFHPNAVNLPVNISPLGVPARDEKLMYGCEPLASALARSRWSRIAGRCLS